MNKRRVIKHFGDDLASECYYIVNAVEIVNKNFCDCYDWYGNTVGCEEAGCWTQEEAEREGERWNGEEEEHHVEVVCIEYWDGHNFKSIILDGDIPAPLEWELLEPDDPEATGILHEYESCKFGEYDAGISRGQTENFEFIKSKFPGFEIAIVELL